MTEQKKVSLAEKVKKLLSLSQSSNPHEAALAAEKARRLLEEYGMTLTDVEVLSAEMIEEGTKVLSERMKRPYKTIPRWAATLASAMQKPFFVEVLRDTYSARILFLGAKQDVEVALYVFNYLVAEIGRLTERFMEEHRADGHPKRYLSDLRFSYEAGAVQGIHDKLKTLVAKAPTAHTTNGTELVVVKGDAVAKFVKQKYPKLRFTRWNARRTDYGAYARGQKDGRNVRIHKGVNTKGGQRSIGH